jgi:osmotically inducible lipoprotein OsmB
LLFILTWETLPSNILRYQIIVRTQSTGGIDMSMKYRTGVAVGVLALTLTVQGCSQPLGTREKGALTGVGLGAATGAIIGAAVGNPGAGAAIGGALGGVGGGLVGDQMQGQEVQQTEQQRQIEEQNREIQQQRRELEALKQRQRKAPEEEY